MILRASDQPSPHAFDKRTLLRAHPFFKDLSNAVIDQLALRAITRKVKKGTVLFRKGDVGSSLYAVSAGAIRISAPSEHGKDATFNVIVPGQIFGEIAFLDGGQRTADAVAAETSELIVFERRDFVHLLHENPEVGIRLIEVLCGRLRRTSEQVEDIVFLGLPGRLAKALLDLDRRSTAGAQPRKIRITQREISQMIGVSRESANKQLRDWQRKKWLKLERGGIAILSRDALDNLVSEGAET